MLNFPLSQFSNIGRTIRKARIRFTVSRVIKGYFVIRYWAKNKSVIRYWVKNQPVLLAKN